MAPPTIEQLNKYGLSSALQGAPWLDVPAGKIDETLKKQANIQNSYNGLYDQANWATNYIAGVGAIGAAQGPIAATTTALTQGLEHLGSQVFTNGYKTTNYNNDKNGLFTGAPPVTIKDQAVGSFIDSVAGPLAGPIKTGFGIGITHGTINTAQPIINKDMNKPQMLEPVNDVPQGYTGEQVEQALDSEPIDALKVGTDVGQLLTLIGRYRAQNPDASYEEAFQYVQDEHTSLNYLIETVSRYNPDTNKNLEVEQQEILDEQEVARIYTGLKEDGRPITSDDCYIKRYPNPDGSYRDTFAFIDETGREIEYTGTHGTVPTIYGNWVGPNSRNDALPVPVFIDVYALGHDQGYHEHGWFDLESDLIFCSRIRQNLHRMSGREWFVANFSLKYFETVGRLLTNARIKNPVAANNNSVVFETQDQGIFSDLGLTSIEDKIKFFKGIQDGYIATNDIIYVEQYDTIVDVLQQLIVVET